jgi:hypothetical protein
MMKNNDALDAVKTGLPADLPAVLSRRGVLKSGLLMGASVGGMLAAPTTALAADAGLPAGITSMSELEYRVLDRLRTILLPVQKFGLPSTTEVPVMANLDDLIGKLNAFPRTLLRVGLNAFEYGSIYKFSRFSQLDDRAAYNTVESWQSGIFFQRGLMSDIKTLVTFAYWRDPRTWTLLEYDGPVTEKWGIRRLGNAPLPRDS